MLRWLRKTIINICKLYGAFPLTSTVHPKAGSAELTFVPEGLGRSCAARGRRGARRFTLRAEGRKQDLGKAWCRRVYFPSTDSCSVSCLTSCTLSLFLCPVLGLENWGISSVPLPTHTALRTQIFQILLRDSMGREQGRQRLALRNGIINSNINNKIISILQALFKKLYFIKYAITVVLIFPPLLPLPLAPPTPSGHRSCLWVLSHTTVCGHGSFVKVLRLLHFLYCTLHPHGYSVTTYF